jgi:hypothetical protein
MVDGVFANRYDETRHLAIDSRFTFFNNAKWISKVHVCYPAPTVVHKGGIPAASNLLEQLVLKYG